MSNIVLYAAKIVKEYTSNCGIIHDHRSSNKLKDIWI